MRGRHLQAAVVAPAAGGVPVTGTRERVLAAALKLFRRRGFDRTTMRDIAGEAGMAVGAAYYYFASKEAIVLAYYDEQQGEHARMARAKLTVATTTRERLGAVFHTKLDVLARDRKLLGALFRSVGDPSDPTGPFGAATREVRAGSRAIFAEALAGEPLDGETRELAAGALWALHMALLLYFLYDPSPRQARTRRLVDGTLDLIAQVLPLGSAMAPIAARIAALVHEAGMLGEGE
jgi:AcrR family transcriptional regulator